MGLPWLDREERGAPQRHAGAFFIGDMPSAHASDSAFSVCVEGVERWLSGSFLWRSASTAGESQTTKKPARRPVSLLSCAPPGNAWEVRMVPRERLELSLCRQKRILNPPRLPIPPPRQWRRSIGRRLPLVNRVRGGENTFPVSYAAFRESPHACRRFSFRLARGPDRPSSPA